MERLPLSVTHPELASELDESKNAESGIGDVSYGMTVKVWWKPPCGHSFDAAPNHRSRGRGCPYCANKRILLGFNDLATTNPEVAREWHPTRNLPVTPQTVTAGSPRKIWWICPAGHEFEQGLSGRTGPMKTSCPYCKGKKVLIGFNDLPTTDPELATEWADDLNLPRTKHDFSRGSSKRAWWRCARVHEWEAIISNRARLGRGCPYCSNRSLLKGYNDLETLHPDIAASFDLIKNFPLTPSDLIEKVDTKCWWICPVGHSWETNVNVRVAGSGCPFCAGKKTLPGFNDLASRRPDLLTSWDYSRNKNVDPGHIPVRSEVLVWWTCPNGHEYKATPSNRSIGRGCPRCAKYGYDPTTPGRLYFLENPDLRARKIGITTPGGTEDRVERFARAGWKLIYSKDHFDGSLVEEVERELFRWLREDQELPEYLTRELMSNRAGNTETFSEEGPSNASIIEKIQSVFKEKSEASQKPA